MRREKILTVSVVLLLLLNGGILIYLFLQKSHRPHGGNPPHHREEGPKKIIIEKLAFDESQIKKYEAIIPSHRKTLDSLVRQLEGEKQSYYSALGEDQIITNSKSLERMSILHKQIDSINFQHFLLIKKICKPEQLESFHELSQDLSQIFGPKKRKS